MSKVVGGLPEGWVDTILGAVTEYGKASKKTNKDVGYGTWVLELEDIEKSTARLITRISFKDRAFKSTKNAFKKGDVLYGKLRPYLNKVIQADSDGVCTTEVIPIDAQPFCLNRYIFYWLRSADFLDYVNKVSYGVNMPRLGTDDGNNAPFRFAPLNEQKVIVDKLDSLLAQVESIKTRLDHVPAIMKRFRQTVLSAAVSGKLTAEWRKSANPESISEYLSAILEDGPVHKNKKTADISKEIKPLFTGIHHSWRWVFLEEISAIGKNALKAGPFGSALKKSDCRDYGYKVYGQEQVIAGDESLITYRIDEHKYKQLESCAVNAGDILISLVGTIGKVLILSPSAEKGIINPRLVKLSLHNEINRMFIKIFIDSPISHSFFKKFSHGGTMEILNLSIIKELPIPLPPIIEQAEIVARVEKLFAWADNIEKQLAEAQKRVNNLTQSILAKAFRGELTEQWRKDNPELISGENSAAALLERIKAERQAATSKRKTKAKKQEG